MNQFHQSSLGSFSGPRKRSSSCIANDIQLALLLLGFSRLVVFVVDDTVGRQGITSPRAFGFETEQNSERREEKNRVDERCDVETK
jgi:hypothetical protein